MVLTLVGLVLASFAFSDSLHKMITRRRSIARAQAELKEVSQRVVSAREDISSLHANSQAYEPLVRKELGYLRPGEKEIRFSKDNSKNP
jgi:cell division protein FtsB